jgi:hypothetical protein
MKLEKFLHKSRIGSQVGKQLDEDEDINGE